MNTGWTPNVSPKPATKQQIDALLARLNSSRHSDKKSIELRKNAIAALQNAAECVSMYMDWAEVVEDMDDFGMSPEDAEADALDYSADVQERADLYALGMGR